MNYLEKADGSRTVKMMTYNNMTEFLDDIKSRPNNRAMDGQTSSHDADERFTGTKNYAEAEELLAHGWEHGAKKITTMLLDRKVQEDFKQSKMVFSVAGSQAVVPLYLIGVPTSMTYRKPVVVKQKIITITKSIDFNGGVASEVIIQNGLRAIQAIQAIESQGFRVKFNLICCSTTSKESVMFKITLKQPNERLNVSKLAFAIGHPSMLRRFSFKWLEVSQIVTDRDFRGGYGGVDDKSWQRLFQEKHEYFIPATIDSLETLVKNITKK